MSDVKFVDGLMVKKPHENAPDFVKCGISLKRRDLMEWLRNESEEWINLQVKESKEGKWYAQVDTWKPKSQAGEAKAAINNDGFDDELPPF